MNQLIDRSKPRIDPLLQAITEAEKLLRPKVVRFLNPNVIDAQIVLVLTVQQGAVGHFRDQDREPSYVEGLTNLVLPSDEAVRSVLGNILKTLRARIAPRLGNPVSGHSGIVTLCAQFS